MVARLERGGYAEASRLLSAWSGSMVPSVERFDRAAVWLVALREG